LNACRTDTYILPVQAAHGSKTAEHDASGVFAEFGGNWSTRRYACWLVAIAGRYVCLRYKRKLLCETWRANFSCEGHKRMYCQEVKNKTMVK